MSTPSSDTETTGAEVQVKPTPGENTEVRDPREWRRQATGIFVGLLLAVLVYIFFPADAAETALQPAGADPDTEYSHQAMRMVTATTILMAPGG